jgi:hypothetical protein
MYSREYLNRYQNASRCLKARVLFGNALRVYSRDEVRDLVFDVGFADIDVSEPVPGPVLARAIRQSWRKITPLR